MPIPFHPAPLLRPRAPAPRRFAPPGHGFLAQAAEALAIMSLFVAFGASTAALLRASGAWPARARPAYPGAVTASGASGEAEREPPRLWLVDGFNVLHVALLGGTERRDWWRGETRERVVQLARSLADPRAEVWIVFDGPRPTAEGDPGSASEAVEAAGTREPRVVFAPSADEWLLARVRELPDPARAAVVTADRRLADRARHRGARVVRPGAFVARCLGASSDSGEGAGET